MTILELMEKLNVFEDDAEVELVIVAEDEEGYKHYITTSDIKVKYQLKSLVSIYGDANEEFIS